MPGEPSNSRERHGWIGSAALAVALAGLACASGWATLRAAWASVAAAPVTRFALGALLVVLFVLTVLLALGSRLLFALAADDRRVARALDSVARADDQELLARWVRDSDPEVARAALERITDQPTLVRLAAEPGRGGVSVDRIAGRIADPSARGRIALKHGLVQLVGGISDEVVLAELAQDAQHSVAAAAVERITDESLLTRVALEGKDPYAAGRAAERVRDPLVRAGLAVRRPRAELEGRSIVDALASLPVQDSGGLAPPTWPGVLGTAPVATSGTLAEACGRVVAFVAERERSVRATWTHGHLDLACWEIEDAQDFSGNRCLAAMLVVARVGSDEFVWWG